MTRRAGRLIFEGIGVSPGYAIGLAHRVDRSRVTIPKYRIDDAGVATQLERFEAALTASESQIGDVRATLTAGSSDHGLILDVHLMMLRDAMLVDATQDAIRSDRINAEWALRKVMRTLKQMFANIEDEYFRERRADVEFVGRRVLRNLMGTGQPNLSLVRPGSIVVAHDLSPADTAFLTEKAILGFATDVGGKTSHTAIMARSLELPAVVGLDDFSQYVGTGDTLIVDGTHGRIIVRPTGEEIARYQRWQHRYATHLAQLTAVRHTPSVTLDAVHVQVAANIERPDEAQAAMEAGADGVGLYRTEYLYMNRATLPDEEEQYAAYRMVVEATGAAGATIRTLDLGGDKLIEPIKQNRELNPVMGLRAVRYCLHEPVLFKAQLRALLRASAHGNLRILVPLISGLVEVRAVRALIGACRAELAAEGLAMADDVPLGVMIELPSAAAIADLLARECDFFAIGTNDLIQYMLAVDRGNEHVAHLYRPLHPAVLRVLASVVAAANTAGIPVSLCGQMASEPGYLPVLLGLGLTRLSMNTTSIAVLKSTARAVSIVDCATLFAEISALDTAPAIEARVALRVGAMLTGLALDDLAAPLEGGD
ncbi:MAG: phosphotransferase system enzyme I (PtsI) [Bradymonadia bacterium]|jgi:phosphotransferase system enzyme I (PtsI)